MGLSERISGWLQRRKEAVHRQRIYRASAYFGSLLKHGEADAVAVRRCVEDYKDFPEMTKRQVELLLEHGSLYSIRQAPATAWRKRLRIRSPCCSPGTRC
jgi:hypothetical protein